MDVDIDIHWYVSTEEFLNSITNLLDSWSIVKSFKINIVSPLSSTPRASYFHISTLLHSDPLSSHVFYNMNGRKTEGGKMNFPQFSFFFEDFFSSFRDDTSSADLPLYTSGRRGE